MFILSMAKVVHHNRRGEFVVTGAVLGAALGVGFSYFATSSMSSKTAPKN